MDAQEQEGGRGEERGETGSRNGGRAGFAVDSPQDGGRNATACMRACVVTYLYRHMYLDTHTHKHTHAYTCTSVIRLHSGNTKRADNHNPNTHSHARMHQNRRELSRGKRHAAAAAREARGGKRD